MCKFIFYRLSAMIFVTEGVVFSTEKLNPGVLTLTSLDSYFDIYDANYAIFIAKQPG